MAEANNIIKDFKALPNLGKDSLYVNLKKEIKILEVFTLCPRKKNVPLLFSLHRQEKLGKQY